MTKGIKQMEDLCVTALKTGTSEQYFSGAIFTLDSGTSTYISANPYYWPGEGSLDFYAYSPAGNEQVVCNSYNSFTVTPDQEASTHKQVDLVYAITTGQNKSANASGVKLTFLHTMSRVKVQLKNSQPNLKFVVEDLKLCFLHKEGTLSITDAEIADIVEEDTLKQSAWTCTGEASAADFYLQACNMEVEAAAEAADAGNPLILVPQNMAKATAYNADKTPNGGYIAIKGKIFNSEDESKVFPEGDEAEYMMFPANFNLAPGMQYTYIVDLAGGGYSENGESGEEGEELKPVIKDSEIIFVNVQVSGWNNVNME